MTQYVDIKTASALVGISVMSLRRGVKAGRFPSIRVGNTPKGKLLFNLQDLAQVLADEAYATINTEKDGE